MFDQLERLEGMRVSVASLSVNAPTDGNVNEPNASSTTTGVFFGMVTGSVARSLRESGIQPPDPAGVESFVAAQVTPDGRSWVYSYFQYRNDLHLVTGLR